MIFSQIQIVLPKIGCVTSSVVRMQYNSSLKFIHLYVYYVIKEACTLRWYYIYDWLILPGNIRDIVILTYYNVAVVYLEYFGSW